MIRKLNRSEIMPFSTFTRPIEQADPRLEFAVSKSMAVKFILLALEYDISSTVKILSRHAPEHSLA